MHPAFEIEDQIRSYLDRRTDLPALRAWFRAAAGALHALPLETRATELTTALQLGLIEFDKGDFSERQLRQHLTKALGHRVQAVVEASLESLTASSDNTIPGLANASTTVSMVTAIQWKPTGTTF